MHGMNVELEGITEVKKILKFLADLTMKFDGISTGIILELY